MGEQDIDPDQTGHLQNFENSFGSGWTGLGP
jgi:hypothetical protein